MGRELMSGVLVCTLGMIFSCAVPGCETWAQESNPSDAAVRESRTRPQPGAPSTDEAEPDKTTAPQQTPSRVSGKASRTGMTSKELKFVRLSLGLDYLVFGGQIFDGFTPSVASNITSYIDLHRGLGTFMIRLRPEAFASVLEARREARSSHAFEQQYKLNARLILAQTFHIPVSQVDTLVPKIIIASTEAKVRDAAFKIVDDRINYTAAWKTALDGITYSVRLPENFDVSAGKNHPYFENDLLPDATSLIFGSVPNATLSYANDYFVPMVRVYHDRKSIESPFGIANAYVRSVLRDGEHFFAISPDSFEFSGNVQPALLQKVGLRGVSALALGAGRRDTDTYGLLRVDLEKSKFHMRNLASWQGTARGVSTQYSTMGTWQVIRRLALGVDYYLHTGTPDSFYHLEPVADLTLRFRPWVGWLGNYQTHIVLKRGYAQGLLVKELTGKSEIAKDWNFEIRMVRPQR